MAGEAAVDLATGATGAVSVQVVILAAAGLAAVQVETPAAAALMAVEAVTGEVAAVAAVGGVFAAVPAAAVAVAAETPDPTAGCCCPETVGRRGPKAQAAA